MRLTASSKSTPRHTRLTAMATMAIAVPIAIACSVPAASASTEHASNAVRISATKITSYGTILVSGTTVYTLKASKVACTAKCLTIWPEVLLPRGATKAVAGPGVNAAKLGTVKRPGNRLQVTYGGAALYWFSKDLGPGQVKGNVTDTWGKWTVVVTVKPNGGVTTTTQVGGGGGGIGF